MSKNFKEIEVECPYCNSSLSYDDCKINTDYEEKITLEDLICKGCKKIFEIEFVPVTIYETGDYEYKEKLKEEDWDDCIEEEEEYEEFLVEGEYNKELGDKKIFKKIINFSCGDSNYTLEYEMGILGRTPKEIAKDYFEENRVIASVQVDVDKVMNLFLTNGKSGITFEILVSDLKGEIIDHDVCEFHVIKDEKDLIYVLTKIC